MTNPPQQPLTNNDSLQLSIEGRCSKKEISYSILSQIATDYLDIVSRQFQSIINRLLDLINYRCSLFVDQQIDRKIAINTLSVMVGQTIPVLTNRWIGQRTKISICKWTVDLG